VAAHGAILASSRTKGKEEKATGTGQGNGANAGEILQPVQAFWLQVFAEESLQPWYVAV
jgi:hypothetical protein